MRKWNEKNNNPHVPKYFEEVYNKEDDQKYWRYTHKYFENDRKNQDWSKLPDLFTEKLPFE